MSDEQLRPMRVIKVADLLQRTLADLRPMIAAEIDTAVAKEMAKLRPRIDEVRRHLRAAARS